MPPAEAAAPASLREWLARLLLVVYKRVLSPVLQAGAGGQCKYLPTCSEYAYVAVVRHGWWRGAFLAFTRFLRCHPFARGGVDPVP